MNEVAFRLGRIGDADAVRALLASAALPVDDLTGGKQEFVVAEVGERVIGCVGVEMAGEACLLRSLVVLPEHRGRGIAAALHERAEALASLRGARAAFLLTTSAAAYAERKGFERIERTRAPAAVASLPQFQGVCPKLVFELEGGREQRVGAGEVIALPAGVPHGTRADAERTRAVDAWSPPRR